MKICCLLVSALCTASECTIGKEAPSWEQNDCAELDDVEKVDKNRHRPELGSTTNPAGHWLSTNMANRP